MNTDVCNLKSLFNFEVLSEFNATLKIDTKGKRFPFFYPFIPASPSRSISGLPFTALQPGAGNKIQVATVSQTNHAPEYQVQLSCSNYFTTACIRLTMAEKISSFTRIV